MKLQIKILVLSLVSLLSAEIAFAQNNLSQPAFTSCTEQFNFLKRICQNSGEPFIDAGNGYLQWRLDACRGGGLRETSMMYLTPSNGLFGRNIIGKCVVQEWRDDGTFRMVEINEVVTSSGQTLRHSVVTSQDAANQNSQVTRYFMDGFLYCEGPINGQKNCSLFDYQSQTMHSIRDPGDTLRIETGEISLLSLLPRTAPARRQKPN